MNIIATIKSWQERCRIIRITHSSIEINHCIICATSTDPRINCLATSLDGSGSRYGSESATIDLKAPRTRSKNELLMPGNHLIRNRPEKQIVKTKVIESPRATTTPLSLTNWTSTPFKKK